MDDRLLRLLVLLGVPAIAIALVCGLVWIGSIWAGVEVVIKAIKHLHIAERKLPPYMRDTVAFLLTSPWVGLAGIAALHAVFFRRLRREVKQTRRIGQGHEHDSVLWVDTGRNDVAGNPIINGPFCPRPVHGKTPQPLSYRNSLGTDLAVDSDLVGSVLTEMFCPKCNIQLILGPRPKKIGDSRREVALNLRGRRVGRF